MTVLHWLTKFQIPEGQDSPCFVCPAPSFRLRFLLDPCAGVAAVSTAKPTTLLGELVEEIMPKVASLLYCYQSPETLSSPDVGSLMCNTLRVLWMGHSGYSSRGPLASDPKTQFCLHNAWGDGVACAVDCPGTAVSFRYSGSWQKTRSVLLATGCFHFILKGKVLAVNVYHVQLWMKKKRTAAILCFSSPLEEHIYYIWGTKNHLFPFSK